MTNHIAKGSKLAKCWVIEIEQAKPSVIKFFYYVGQSQVLITSITAKVKLHAADGLSPSYSWCTPHTNSHGYEEMDVLRDNKQDNLKTEISIEAKELPAADGLSPSYSWCTPHTNSHGYEEMDVLRDNKQDNLKPKIHVDVDKNVNSSYNSHQPRVAYVPAFPSEAGNKDSKSKPYEPYRPDYEVFQFKFKPKISK